MIDYKAAGVNIDAGNEIVKRIKEPLKKTFDSNVLSSIGGFASFYDLQSICRDYAEPVLVQSIDGLGTKPMIAKLMQNYNYLGDDLLSATCNDIIVCGAKPLTLLDYIGSSQLQPNEVVTIIESMSRACIANDVSLVGGETAEMPGVYRGQEYDIVGIITGVVEKQRCITGKDIVPGDSVLGFSSSGLHTNGYSLARKLCFEQNTHQVEDYISELGSTLGEALIAPHINYTKPVMALTQQFNIKGMAHITGGGVLENIPRILPADCDVALKNGSWPKPPIFDWLLNLADLNPQEAYRVFNMGIGYILIVDSELVNDILSFVACHFNHFSLYEIGTVAAGKKQVHLL